MEPKAQQETLTTMAGDTGVQARVFNRTMRWLSEDARWGKVIVLAEEALKAARQGIIRVLQNPLPLRIGEEDSPPA